MKSTEAFKEVFVCAMAAGLMSSWLYSYYISDHKGHAPKKALETKKKITKLPSRSSIQKNSYEDVIARDVIKPDQIEVEFDSIKGHAPKKALEAKKKITKPPSRPSIQKNSYEDVIASDVINPDQIEVEFDSIGGLESIKQSLHELVILPLRRPELFLQGKLLGPQKGVLIQGPPGTGKTMLAKAIAKESGAAFINVSVANLTSKWFGESEKLVTALFSLAHKLQPAIIFIDEVDSLLGKRRDMDLGVSIKMKTTFMTLWDGFTTNQNARVMVLGATNRPKELDEAILRRFPQTFEVGLPDQRGRVDILKVILKGEKVESLLDIDHIAGLCDGYSGSDLLELCKQAAYFPIRDHLNAEKSGLESSELRPLSQTDLEKVLAAKRKTKDAASEYCNSMYI